ncbi:MAG: hypothetical protein HOC71_06315, partial [Candidatus Latescibacteria bacterium]|nr:hypothetical protein [Candidatus Latescibacterota bacterium]
MKKSWLILMIFLCSINPASGGQIVITTSDYSSGNTASYNIETGTMTNELLPHHQDTNVKTDGTFLYILEGYGKNSIIKVDPSPISVNNVIYNYSLSGDGSETNPQNMVFLDSKAYILLGDSDKIWVVNQNAANEASFKIGEIDISQWSDSDGSPDAALGFVYDGMVYVVLQGVIKSWPSIYETARIIKIDPSTDTRVE